MHMRASILLILLISAVLVSCSSGDSGQTGQIRGFAGGTQGLSMEFVQGQPPREVFDGGQDTFEIALQLRNRGEFEITNGYIELDGILPQEFGRSDADFRQSIPILEPRRLDSSGRTDEGGFDVLTFGRLSYSQNLVGSTSQKNVRAIACYDYETQVIVENVCIRPEGFRTADADSLCQVSGTKRVANSGGPIQIQNVRQSASGANRVSLSFDVVHVGSGDRFFHPRADSCHFRTTDPNLYRIEVSVGNLVNNQIQPTCSGFSDGTSTRGELLMMGGGSRTFSCNFDISSISRNAEVPLSLTLSYKYMDSITKQFAVRRVD